MASADLPGNQRQAGDPPIRIAICAIGSELTDGRFVDTNSAWLSQQLRELGLTPELHLSLPDRAEVMFARMSALWQEGYSLVCCGGIGPTVDDLTREVCARVLGSELAPVDAALEKLRAYYQSMGRPDPTPSERQVQVPRCAEPILNDYGTATGIQCFQSFQSSQGSQFMLALPGVPREIHGMWRDIIKPRLERDFSRGGQTSRELIAFGITERRMNRELKDLLDVADEGIEASILVNDFVVRLRWAAAEAHADRIAELEEAALERLGSAVFHRAHSDGPGADLVLEGADPLAAVLMRQLQAREEQASFAESCTGGMAAQLLTSVPGSSAVIEAGAVSYSNRIKQQWLGVPLRDLDDHGAVSAEVVRAMASGVRQLSGANWGVAISGVAGPGGGSEYKPVGTVWFGLNGPYGSGQWKLRFPGDRHLVRWRSARMALNLIRLSIHFEGLPSDQHLHFA